MSGFVLQRVPSVSGPLRNAAYAVSGLAAVLVAAVLLRLLGLHPATLGAGVLRQSFGSRFGFEDLALLCAPLVMCGLSVSLMLRVGLWNIGADGQFYTGAACAAGVALFAPPWSPVLVQITMGLAAMAGGAAWIAIPALARLLLGTSEIITTLLLNFIARLGLDWLVTGPWRDRHGSAAAQTARIPDPLPRLPRDWHLGGLHWGLLVVVLAAVLLSAAFRYTRWGFELRICGSNRDTAAYAGMDVRTRLLQAMLLGGAIAGLGGMLEVAGTVHRLQGGLSNGYGYIGIIVAVLAASSPLGCIVTGVLMALVLNAGTVLQTQGVPSSAALALTGLILLFAAIGERLAHYRLQPVRPAAGGAA